MYITEREKRPEQTTTIGPDRNFKVSVATYPVTTEDVQTDIVKAALRDPKVSVAMKRIIGGRWTEYNDADAEREDIEGIYELTRLVTFKNGFHSVEEFFVNSDGSLKQHLSFKHDTPTTKDEENVVIGSFGVRLYEAQIDMVGSPQGPVPQLTYIEVNPYRGLITPRSNLFVDDLITPNPFGPRRFISTPPSHPNLYGI